jgi:uncharacterized protein
MTELDEFRAAKNEFFAKHPQSPLAAHQKPGFKGLVYFPENPALRLEVAVDEFPVKDEISVQTTTGATQPYQRWGRFHFTVEAQPVALTLYSSDNGLFLPFVDSLAGKETYPAGRYLEPEPLGDGRYLIDFNLAYNPYCAYNDRWSCPLTPFENRLKVPIRAGEKIFPH